MIKADIIAILKANKGYIKFEPALKLSSKKKAINSIDLQISPIDQREGVRVYHELGASDLDYCESEVIETISEHLSKLQNG